jgi:hypothetical protein
MAKEKIKSIEFCPVCAADNVAQELLHEHGGRHGHFCMRGHEFNDMEDLGRLMTNNLVTIQKFKRQLNQVQVDVPKEPPKVPELEKPKEQSGKKAYAQSLIENSVEVVIENSQESGIANLKSALPETDVSVSIGRVDKVRLESILGSFNDSSTLFGSVFAMNEELGQLRDKFNRSIKATPNGSVGEEGNGDMAFRAIIPERHVQPIKDLAEGNGLTVEEYMNSRIEEGMDGMWYY